MVRISSAGIPDSRASAAMRSSCQVPAFFWISSIAAARPSTYVATSG
jgi:hypothetical protein